MSRSFYPRNKNFSLFLIRGDKLMRKQDIYRLNIFIAIDKADS